MEIAAFRSSVGPEPSGALMVVAGAGRDVPGGGEGRERKPKLLFFQWDHAPNVGLTDYLVQQVNDHVRCLQEYFDVSVVNQDGDYARYRDSHEPELVLVEAGFQTFCSRRPRITNIEDDGIPKLGLLNADSWSNCRAGFLSDMQYWGIDTYFSICATTAQYIPEIADQVFVWPNFIDSGVYRNYGLEKTIPVMLSGQRHEQYPWRKKVFPLVQSLFPSLDCPQFQHGSGLSHRMLTGVDYARALNASRLSLTCGTMAGEVVRKHFEIPGAGAGLVCEYSPHLAAAGFVHMENCAFAEPGNVVEIMDHLLANPELLARMSRNGQELVHRHHTMRHRPQILQWYRLNQICGPNQKITQQSPFGELALTERSSGAEMAPVVWTGLDRAALRSARLCLAREDTDSARQGFETALSYVPYLPEAILGLAECDLLCGHPKVAAGRLAQLVEQTTANYGARDPDPVEWSMFIVAVLAQGQLARAVCLADWYPDLMHRELQYTREALQQLSAMSPKESWAPARKSIHQRSFDSYEDWLQWLIEVLTASGQTEFATQLQGKVIPQVSPNRGKSRLAFPPWQSMGHAMLRRVVPAQLTPNLPPGREFGHRAHMTQAARRHLASSQMGRGLRRRWRMIRGWWELQARKRDMESTRPGGGR